MATRSFERPGAYTETAGARAPRLIPDGINESGSKQPSVTTFSRLLAAAGSRLTVEHAHASLVEPSPAELARAGATLAEVITLAEALPVRHSRKLRYPRLDRST